MKKRLFSAWILMILVMATLSGVAQSFISPVFTFDTKPPVINLTTPNGGQSYPATLPLQITWGASDDYFGSEPISIGIKTSATGTYNTLMEQLYNTGSQAVQPPAITTPTARIKVTARDYFGNTASDTSDAWFILTGGGDATIVNLTNQQDGSAVMGALVTGYSGTGQYGSIPSGNPGQYLLYLPAGNGYDLRISAPGFMEKEVKNLSVVSGSGLNLYFQMQPVFGFSEFRVVPVTLAPNPALLEIPEGGIGYAWFVVEGLLNGQWLPVPNIRLNAVDTQFDTIECRTNYLSYNFLSSLYHMQNAGVFAIKIPTSKVGSGAPGDQETFTVVSANGVALPVANRQSITAKVVPYTYSTSWDYRIYGKLGLSAGIPNLAKATGFIGGGSGSMMKIKLAGLSSNPTWSEFQISRRRDIFVGVSFGVGPPDIIPFLESDLGLEAETKLSFPYQSDYAFDMNTLQGLESLLAFYLFYEPTILFAGKTIPGGVIGTRVLSWMVEAIIANSAQNGLGIVRFADETGLNLTQSASAGIQIGLVSTTNFGIAAGPSLGLEANIGGSLRKENNTAISRFYIDGGYEATINIGPKWISKNKIEFENIYPHRLRNIILPSSLAVNFEGKYVSQNNAFKEFELTCGLESNSTLLNFNNIGGQTQQYNVWLNADNEYVKNILYNVSTIPSEIGRMGIAATQLSGHSNTFDELTTNFLSAIYQEQNNDKPAKLGYGFDAAANSRFNIDLDLDIPIPAFPAISINVGGGIEAGHSTEYNLSQGYWVKGLPYLQTEMPNPPNPQVTFGNAMTTLWNQVVSGQTLQELLAVIMPGLNNGIIKWLFGKSPMQTIALNDEGSTLKIHPQSIPPSLDSATFKHWEWTPEDNGDHIPDLQKRVVIMKYAHSIRQLRQAASGLTFGIGGFYAFEPKGNVFGDSTLITIAYPDSAVIGLDETKLAVYWEDTLGIWHYIPSVPMPDSNKVSAYIHHFTTYTLAPSLPQGEYGFDIAPESIPADGFSSAIALSDMMYNSDSTVISDSTLFTVSASRGTILTSDVDPTRDGTQVFSIGGKISLTVKADTIANPIVVIARSLDGYATAIDSLPLFDLTPPAVPVITAAIPLDGAILLQWNPSVEHDIAGYLVCYDTDTLTPPYNGTANVWGQPSPVSVGISGDYRLPGLKNYETYYLSLRAFDISGNISGYATPVAVALNPPITVLTVSGDTIFATQTECFNATDTLRTGGSGGNFLVKPGGEARLIAGKRITMLSGTRVQPDGYLHAFITTDEQFCSRIGETGIPVNMEVTNEQIQSPDDRCFNATGTLQVAGNGNSVSIYPGGSATFLAGQRIRFLPGFVADSGAYALGKIILNGQYCNDDGDHPSGEQLLYDRDEPRTETANNNLFRLWPNPAGSEVTFALSDASQNTLSEIVILNLTGHEIRRERMYGSIATLSLYGLEPGLYLVRLTTNGKTGVAKLVKR